MKKLLLIIIFIVGGILFSTPTAAADCASGLTCTSRASCLPNESSCTDPATGNTVCCIDPTPTPTPSIEPAKIKCPNSGTVYPPNTNVDCYPEPDKVERIGINLFDSNESFLTYLLTCISAPTVTYKETFTDYAPPPTSRTVNITSNVSEAQLGFLGPDSTTLAGSNPDKLAQKYLFNALFDRPGADPNAQRESFRTYWRMLDNLSQAKLKAYYLEKTTNHTYFYVGSDYKQHEVDIENLKNKLPACLKQYGSDTCWQNEKYVDDYLALDQATKDEYDALLPFDFNNSRGYLSNGSVISNENIPYLRAIISGLKGYRNDFLGFPNTVIPGLFDYYTPESARRNLALYPALPFEETFSFQYPIIKIIAALNNNCSAPTGGSSLSSPKTFSSPSSLTQTVTVPVSSKLISSTPDKCVCDPETLYCYVKKQYIPSRCHIFSNNETMCVKKGCLFFKGEDTYELTGSAVGSPITVFNNPNVTSLTDLVMGGKPLISNKSENKFTQVIIDLINTLSDKLISPVQPSFYKMLLPDFASESAKPKALVSAPSVSTTTDNQYAAVSGSNTIYRENNLAQDTMHLLQNCWLVPSDQQSSSKCGQKPLAGTCDGTRLKEILGDSIAPPSSAANSYFYSYILPRLTPEVVSAYSAGEKATGVPCEVLAGIHYEEGGNEPGRSLQDGRPLSGMTLEESAIKAGQELNGKAGGEITGLDSLISSLSRYNGGGNSNCQISSNCSTAASLDRCGMTVACSTDVNSCFCVKTGSEVGSCRKTCGSASFPWTFSYNYCSPHPKEGYDDPYATDMWKSPENDNMYLLYQYDCTQTKPIFHARPGVLTIALSLYLTNNPNP